MSHQGVLHRFARSVSVLKQKENSFTLSASFYEVGIDVFDNFITSNSDVLVMICTAHSTPVTRAGMLVFQHPARDLAAQLASASPGRNEDRLHDLFSMKFSHMHSTK